MKLCTTEFYRKKIKCAGNAEKWKKCTHHLGKQKLIWQYFTHKEDFLGQVVAVFHI